METGIENLRSLFERRFGAAPDSVAALAGSGSGRKYFRLSGRDMTCIGVVGENVAENDAFVYLAGHFRSRGIRVPEVYAVSSDRRCYLQRDLGSESLFDAVAEGRERARRAFRAESARGRSGTAGDAVCPMEKEGERGGGEEVIYSRAEEDLLCRTIAALPKIQFAGAEGLDFSRCFPVPRMSVRSIMFDLNYFKYCYLLGSGMEYDESRLQDEFEALSSDLLSEPFDTFMYRDFQARNVMLVDGEPWFIDFQGGRRGPVYYDVASFVYQAVSRFPTGLRSRMIDSYLEALQPFRRTDRGHFMARLRLFLLFRTMQVLGAYGFRGLYQRKPHFLESIPYALENLRELLAEPFPAYPYLTALLTALAGMEPAPGQEDRRTSVPESATERGDSRTTGLEQGSPAMAGQNPESGAERNAGEGRLKVKVTSFSYKDGIPEDSSGNGGGYVFDCRGMNNPGRYERYRRSTGRDADVIEFLETDGGVFKFLEGVYAMVDPHVETFLGRGFTSLCVNFGCTGGRHRSVYCAEALAGHLAGKFPEADILLTHTKLGLEREIMHRV